MDFIETLRQIQEDLDRPFQQRISGADDASLKYAKNALETATALGPSASPVELIAPLEIAEGMAREWLGEFTPGVDITQAYYEQVDLLNGKRSDKA